VTAATATPNAGTHIRQVLPLAMARDLEGTRLAHPSSPSERPASIKEAIIRWLNEEL
jgi:hypothetical protein